MEKEKKRRGGLYTSDCDDLAIDSDSAHHEALQHLQSVISVLAVVARSHTNESYSRRLLFLVILEDCLRCKRE